MCRGAVMILEHVFQELNRRKIRYWVAGGVASILYGNPRFTKDLDLWVDLREGNLKRLIGAFKKLKFIPRAPVKPEDFISAKNRKMWQGKKGMKAFTFINPKNPYENIDILLNIPFSFKEAYQRKEFFLSGPVPIPTVSRKDLILMKKHAGRTQDFQDIKILEAVQEKRRREGPEE